MNDFELGYFLGSTMTSLGILALFLIIGKLPRFRNKPKLFHVLGIVAVWLVAFLGIGFIEARSGALSVLGAYVATLLGVWSYWRIVKTKLSGWTRIGVVLTAILTVILFPISLMATDGGGSLIAANTLVVLVALIWFSGFAVRWIREGFRTG